MNYPVLLPTEDESPARRDAAGMFQMAVKSSEAARDIVRSSRNFHAVTFATSSGSGLKQSFATAIAAPSVVTNIGELIYEANAASVANRAIARKAAIFTNAISAVDPAIRALPSGMFKLLQAWDGLVLTVTDAEFVAKISDKTNPSNPIEEVTLSKEEITPSEQTEIVPGAVFYWSIGYKDAPGEPRRRTSQIRFRRLPPWTTTEIDFAEKYAATLREALRGLE